MKELIPYSLQEGLAQSGSYVLMLMEPISQRQIPIIVGSAEAQAILLAKQEVKTRRPIPHKLMSNILESFRLQLKKVVIDHVSEGIFYSTLHITDGFSEHTFDSRTTDAIALALHCDAPIMAEEKVIEETSVAADNDDASTPSLEELERELSKCEQREDYERAARIQEQIEKIRHRQ